MLPRLIELHQSCTILRSSHVFSACYHLSGLNMWINNVLSGSPCGICAPTLNADAVIGNGWINGYYVSYRLFRCIKETSTTTYSIKIKKKPGQCLFTTFYLSSVLSHLMPGAALPLAQG